MNTLIGKKARYWEHFLKEIIKTLKTGNVVFFPKCFKNIKDITQLPVTWKNDSKGLVNNTMFEDWLKDYNKTMKKKKQNILLFVDNAPNQPEINLFNVMVKFFPANCISKLQPTNQGIIKSLKIAYKKRLLRHVLAKISTWLIKSVNSLDAIYWVYQVWIDIKLETIRKCFA